MSIVGSADDAPSPSLYPVGAFRVILVEDDSADASLVRKYLSCARGYDFEVHWSRCLDDALQVLGERGFDAALVDLGLPDTLDLEALVCMRAMAPELPLVVVTGDTSESRGLLAVQGGAQDYISKDQLNPDRLSRALRHAIERRRYEMQLERLAHFDSVTGLPNRTLFFDRVDAALTLAGRRGTRAAVLYLDLDRFKKVNDTLGHTAGDELLMRVGRRLARTLRNSDSGSAFHPESCSAARLGGDTFAVLLEDIPNEVSAMMGAERILKRLADPITIGDSTFVTTTSIGVALFPEDGTTRSQLLAAADEAMYRAKQRGRDNCQMYSEQLQDFARQRLRTDADLRKGLQEEAFRLHYQSQFDLRKNRVVGVEALLRWQREPDRLVYPAEFVDRLEESGMMIDVGRWVLQTACEAVQLWEHEIPKLRISVNISARQLLKDDFVETVQDVLQSTGLAAERLELEFKENDLLRDPERTTGTLLALRKCGVRLAIDDFGSGYSSLDYLRRFPVNVLKLDRSFVCDLASNMRDAGIARAIIELAHQLGIEVVAEGVETEEQLNILRAAGCDGAQGFLLSRPAALDEIIADSNSEFVSQTLFDTIPPFTRILPDD